MIVCTVRFLEICYSSCACVLACVLSCFSCVLLFETSWTIYSPPGSSIHGIHQARILEWLPFLSPEDLPNPGIEPAPLATPALPGRCFITESPVKPIPSETSTFNQPKPILFPISKSLLFFCGSVVQSCLTLYNPMDCSTPGFLVLPHLPELAQTHVY